MKKLLLLVMVIGLVVGGCAGISNNMQRQVGTHISTIIQQHGPAQSVTPDGIGGLCYTWRNWIPTGYGNGYWRSRTFYADKEGIIYRWYWKGL